MAPDIQVTTSFEDKTWDQFLESMPHGQFQQSSLWAEAKKGEGWNTVRALLRDDGRLIGGVQVLWRQSRLGRIGFINKGPVLESGSLSGQDVVGILTELQSKHKWKVLITQAPDFDPSIAAKLEQARFHQTPLLQIIDSTLMIDLTGGWKSVFANFRKTTQQSLRQALQRGAAVFEGNESDIDSFFALMLESCRRQGVKPNPSTPSSLIEIWQAFQPYDKARLFFVTKDGTRIAGALCLSFGDRVTLWKKGWNGSHSECFPNILVTAEAIRWAIGRGARWFDFVALDREVSKAMAEGVSFPKNLASKRDFFHLGFGGKPFLLPKARVRFENAAYDRILRLAACWPIRGWLRPVLNRTR